MDTEDGQAAQMAITWQPHLILALDNQEMLCPLPNSLANVEKLTRDWVKPPPGTTFSLRIHTEYTSLHTTRVIAGPYIYLNNEDSYQVMTTDVKGLRIEIVSGAPPAIGRACSTTISLAFRTFILTHEL
ncbi:hypothetical protein P691DRAFT_136712 [Macrolepiota fuliginosa MF-IS2]|uniref:Uncharacterized protein n=1 Tax=Macrolepiota fuliginosa MF-IS2 TaxID=1400762 RepID=A0A9P5XCA9_9AGAR|nr:hypothetical protein P691DRAFT_136712 [Macrolepiota fuliginosa MF-IS2]